ncbi:hypothetical protein GGI43DRAFT_427774 [Trichoderma evansii]
MEETLRKSVNQTLRGHKLLILTPQECPQSYLASLRGRFPDLQVVARTTAFDTVAYNDTVPVDYWDGVTILMTGSSLPTVEQAAKLEPQITEWVIGTFLAHRRKLPQYLDFQRDAHWERFEDHPADSVGQTIGILGYGAIGRQVARVCKAMGMNIHAHTFHPRNTPESRYQDSYTPAGLGDPEGVLPSKWFSGTSKQEIHEFLDSGLDVLVISIPLTEKTKGLLSTKEFEILGKKKTFVSNISRGQVVDTDALIDALEGDVISGAAIDVTDPEPLPDGHRLWKTKNLILTPHVGGQSKSYAERALAILEANLSDPPSYASIMGLEKACSMSTISESYDKVKGNEEHILSLPGGRKLAYAHNGPSKSRTIVIFFPGIMSVGIAADVPEACREIQAHWISPTLPGMGNTSTRDHSVPYYVSLARDMTALLNHLYPTADFDTVYVAGASYGTVPAQMMYGAPYDLFPFGHKIAGCLLLGGFSPLKHHVKYVKKANWYNLLSIIPFHLLQGLFKTVNGSKLQSLDDARKLVKHTMSNIMDWDEKVRLYGWLVKNEVRESEFIDRMARGTMKSCDNWDGFMEASDILRSDWGFDPRTLDDEHSSKAMLVAWFKTDYIGGGTSDWLLASYKSARLKLFIEGIIKTLFSMDKLWKEFFAMAAYSEKGSGKGSLS